MDWLIYMKSLDIKVQRCLEAGHFSQDDYEQSVESSSVLHGAVLTFYLASFQVPNSQRWRFLDSLKSDTLTVIVNAWDCPRWLQGPHLG